MITSTSTLTPHNNLLLLFTTLLLTLLSLPQSATSRILPDFIPINPTTNLIECADGEYFDTIGFVCLLCSLAIENTIPFIIPPYIIPQTSTLQNGDLISANSVDFRYTLPTTCVCDTTFNPVNVEPECTSVQRASGSCKGFACAHTCITDSKSVWSGARFTGVSSTVSRAESMMGLLLNGGPGDGSLDESCVPCGLNANFSATYGTCECANPAISTDTGSAAVRVRSQYLNVVYNETTGTPITKDCAWCPAGSAVFTDDIIKSHSSSGEGDNVRPYMTTGGKRFYANSHECQWCPSPAMFVNELYNCVCSSGYILVGDSDTEYAKCIKYRTSDHSNTANFYSVQNSPSGLANNRLNIKNSLPFVTYYAWGASLCEELVSPVHTTSSSACQLLANLCVLELYDSSGTACTHFQNNIIDVRTTLGEKKFMAPWLYYIDNDQVVRTERSIRMDVSFAPLDGFTNKLTYKLGKYNLKGEFLGFEGLDTQFGYCGRAAPDTERGGGTSFTSKFLNFGNSVRETFSCDLELLEEREMFFYDLYLVDEAEAESSECDGYMEEDLCLYPVPVLQRNLRLDSQNVNENIKSSEEFDDVFTRRFFFFDNMSGRTQSGLSVLRYAKKITLQVSIQTEITSKIFPPVLVIEYVERETSTWSNRETDSRAKAMAVDDVVFKAEYSMSTDNFWDNVDILIGFVIAIAGVIWLVRARNWQNRNQRVGNNSMINNQDATQASGAMYVVHLVMLGAHTFVIVFFPFIFALCSYWFVFFKLQSTVFLLMPVDNEYYTDENEYFFYVVFFQVLFWSDTAYILYRIQQQCNTDIFFVDWEKPKQPKSDTSVSIWRTLMVANEWNAMQTMRKTSIEFSLIVLSFFLIGLRFKNNSTMVPNVSDLSEGHHNIVLAFCNNTWWFVVCYMIQVVWKFVFYERYYREPKSQIFVDLCTMAKISVFIMDEPYHGYYLHCRSPYEFADGSMTQLAEQLKKEESGLTTDRGLDAPGAPRDCQTYELFTSPTFRSKFDKVYSALHQSNSAALAQDTGRLGHMVGRAGGKGRSPPPERMVHALKELNGFLQAFVEQSPPPLKEELKRIVREPTIVDRLMGNPPADVSSNNAKCIFYPDKKTWLKDHAFLSVVFMGLERDLLVHNILTFNFFEMWLENPGVSIFFTYLVHLFLVWLRGSFGQGNLASKTLVDDRFLV